MSALKMATHGASRWVVVLVLLALPIGLAVGRYLPADRERTFDYLYAVLAPALIALACFRALTVTTKRARWAVPIFLAVAVVNVINRPHVPTLSALSIAAAAVATVAALRNRSSTALLSVIVACVAISASLLVGLHDT